MKEHESALFSEYIIDGIRCESTPADMLKECMDNIQPLEIPEEKPDDIIDETIEPPLTSFTYDDSLKEVYLSLTTKSDSSSRAFRILYPYHFTRLKSAEALIDRIWNEGHFRLRNLSICAAWEWNTRPVGSMAAFHASAEALSSYMYDLGIKIEGVEFHESDLQSHFTTQAWLRESPSQDNPDEEGIQQQMMFKSSPYESAHPWIEDGRRCPGEAVGNPDTWLIFIPFDTCSFKLGGSLLSEMMDHNGEQAPSIQDPDYFIDCYEVVRELVEDGIVVAGRTVADGGLYTAIHQMCSSTGADIDIERLMSSYQTESQTKVLFGEVPGVLLQIEDNDYDYVDSQLTLQDVAYYPLGHPTSENKGICISASGGNGVAGILASLLGQASEGED
jgi:hypothetical protein